MKCFRASNLWIFGLFFFIFLFRFPLQPIIGSANEIQRTSFDASITSDKDEYLIYEDIIATFNFSSHITTEDYFCYAISENISFNPIFQSDPVQGNFSKSETYVFSLLDLNYTFSSQEKDLYLLLYYFDEIFGDDICCSKSVSIKKVNLACEDLNNITDLDSNYQYNLSFNFYCVENSSRGLLGERITCIVLFDEKFWISFFTSISSEGSIHIVITPENSSMLCEILVFGNSSRIFNPFNFHFQYNIIPQFVKPKKVTQILTISIVIAIVFSGLVPLGIWYYKKKLKRSYKVHKIKL